MLTKTFVVYLVTRDTAGAWPSTPCEARNPREAARKGARALGAPSGAELAVRERHGGRFRFFRAPGGRRRKESGVE